MLLLLFFASISLQSFIHNSRLRLIGMGRHQQPEPEPEQQKSSKSRPNKRKKIMVYCFCPCRAISSMLRGIGRCMFVSCYPVLLCTGLDEYRHRHHDHHHKHFDW